jgi:hypothetical protein
MNALCGQIPDIPIFEHVTHIDTAGLQRVKCAYELGQSQKNVETNEQQGLLEYIHGLIGPSVEPETEFITQTKFCTGIIRFTTHRHNFIFN